jgi:hypothetical protein
MRVLLRLVLVLGLVAALHPTLKAQSPLQKELKDLDIAPHWIYDDLPKAMAQAKASGKPILVVLRCVPCPPGRTLDRQLMQPDSEIEKLEKNFVCVRIVQAKGLDIKLFQFDNDQSWCAFFLNADGTIYGRYGTRDGRGPQSDTYLSLPSFRKAVERVLQLHKDYPANKEQLAGKIGKAPPYSVPEKIPGLQDRAGGVTTRKTCIHCHMVRENILRTLWKEKRLKRDELWVYPMPDRIGLRMNPRDGLTVRAVVPNSPAAKAGLATGDELMALNRQPLISLADVQWVLHTVPNETRLTVTLKRKGESLEKTVTLAGNWKETDIGWRATSWFGLRHGLKVDPLSAAEKKTRGIAETDLALVVKGMFGPGPRPLTQAGLRNGDVIVAVNGKTAAMTESQFLVYLRSENGPDDSVKLTILRGKNRQELTVPMW